MIDINNIVRGICNLEYDKELYHEEIEEFCRLMCKSSFAHKVSKRFDVIYTERDYTFNPDTEDDQMVKPADEDNNTVFHIRLIDKDTYIVIKDYIHLISIPINAELAKVIVENGIDKLTKEYYE